MITQVYFIECSGRIKIGHTQDLAGRLKSLSTGSAHDLNVVCVVPGSRHLERAIHDHLKARRLRGEWFADCPEVRALAQRLLREGNKAIGFTEPRPPKPSVPAERIIPEPIVSPLRPGIRRIEACMDRYVGEQISSARAKEAALELESGTLINPMIGGYFSSERAAQAFAMIRGTTDLLGKVLEDWINAGMSADPVAQVPFVERSLLAVGSLEKDLAKLFADPIPMAA